jgi:hypothetical protein
LGFFKQFSVSAIEQLPAQATPKKSQQNFNTVSQFLFAFKTHIKNCASGGFQA